MAAPQVSGRAGIQEWVETTNEVGADLGDATVLTVGASVAAGLNTLDSEIGDLSTLETNDQTSLVNAINEVKDTAFIMGLVLATPLN